MDVEVDVVAAVNTLASHSGSSAATASGLLHQSGKPVGMHGPPPGASPPTPDVGPCSREPCWAAAGDLCHSESMPLPLAACSAAVALWLAGANHPASRRPPPVGKASAAPVAQFVFHGRRSIDFATRMGLPARHPAGPPEGIHPAAAPPLGHDSRERRGKESAGGAGGHGRESSWACLFWEKIPCMPRKIAHELYAIEN
jgi:hypothetical protein